MTGLSSAGKTTIIRQLLLLCNQKRNYSFCNESWQEERYDQGDNEFWIETIRKNVLDAFYILIKQIKSENISFDNEDDEEFANIIEDIFDLNEEIEHEMENTPNFSQRLLSLLQSQPVSQDRISNLLLIDPINLEKTQQSSSEWAKSIRRL